MSYDKPMQRLRLKSHSVYYIGKFLLFIQIQQNFKDALDT
jgi:hypothetical protein